MQIPLAFLLLAFSATLAPAQGHPWVDLAGQLRIASHSPGAVPRAASLTVGGIDQPGIFQHANAPNQPLSEITFRALRFPSLDHSIRSIKLRTSIGFKDGEAFISAKSDGCIFTISANGEEIFTADYSEQKWSELEIDLSHLAGKDVTLKFRIDPKKTSAADWASWAKPTLYLQGDAAALRERSLTGIGLPEHWPIKKLLAEKKQPQRTFFHSENLHISVMNEHLDLATATSRLAAKIPAPKVPLPPRIVVGQGASPQNHTLIKVLGPHGIAEAQFLAFPPSIRGGVQVESVNQLIAATPLASGTPEVRFFDKNGTPTGSIKQLATSPLLLASGDFTDDDGEELAITERHTNKINIYSSALKLVETKILENAKITSLTTDATNKKLLAYQEVGRKLTTIDPRTGISIRPLPMLPPGRSVFPTVFAESKLWAAGPQKLKSHTFEISADGTHIGRDLGTEENQFWIALPKEWEGELGKFEGAAKAKHIKLGVYGHIRVDAMSQRYTNPEKGEWAGKPFLGITRNLLKPLDQQRPKMWNPTFTHRMFPAKFRTWAEAIDPATNLNRYLQQSLAGGIDGYGQWDKKILISSTYAPSATELQKLYTLPLRTFLRHWSPNFHRHPGLAPSIEPNHEFESVVATHGGVGDYNPHMIHGFFEWLIDEYGYDPDAWQKRFGVRFDQHFDAPRGLSRASWDAYSTDNPWLLAWVEYNRHVINRTLAISFREALTAGIPPEIIRSHQIPDRYATPPLLKGLTRITPIDYAMTAGVGMGLTKFGTNYDKPQGNVIQAAKTSGFDSFVMGEFQPLTLDPVVAEKELRYVFANGAKAIHPLYWSAQHTQQGLNPDDAKKNQTLYDAMQKLILEDPPRSGQAGGIGQVRPFSRGEERYNIVSIGTGNEHRGLLKSIRADGRMEGSVYAIPFHQQIRIEPLQRENHSFHIKGETTPASQIEISGIAPAAGVKIQVLRGSTELKDMTTTLNGNFRYTLRLPERCSDLSIRFDREIKIHHATLQSPEASDIHRGRHNGIPHKSGITFDTLSN